MHATLRPRTMLFALAAIVAGCSSDPATGNRQPGTAELKVVHASPALGALDVRVADVAVVNGLAYGRSSAAVAVPSGIQVITLRSGGVQVAQFNADLAEDHGNALTVGEDTSQLSTVVPDTGIAASNRANLRVINVVGTNTSAPTMMHVRINFPGVSVDSSAAIGLNTTIASHGPLMYFDVGHFRVRLVAQGSTTVLAEADFNIAAGERKAIVIERSANGTYTMKIVTET